MKVPVYYNLDFGKEQAPLPRTGGAPSRTEPSSHTPPGRSNRRQDRRAENQHALHGVVNGILDFRFEISEDMAFGWAVLEAIANLVSVRSQRKQWTGSTLTLHKGSEPKYSTACHLVAFGRGPFSV